MCDSLNANGPQMLVYLNACSPVSCFDRIRRYGLVGGYVTTLTGNLALLKEV